MVGTGVSKRDFTSLLAEDEFFSGRGTVSRSEGSDLTKSRIQKILVSMIHILVEHRNYKN